MYGWFDNERLKELLKEKGMSQAALARALGINPRLVCRYCHGQRKPRIDTLLRMAEVLRVPVNELVPPERYRMNDYGGWDR